MNEVDVALSSYIITDLGTLPAIQNGHIVNIFKSISHSKKNKTPEIMEKLSSCAQNVVSEQAINDVIKDYRKLNKSKSKESGQRNLVAFFNYFFCNVDNRVSRVSQAGGRVAGNPPQSAHGNDPLIDQQNHQTSVPKPSTARAMRLLERTNRSLRIQIYTLRKENRELKEDKLTSYRTRVKHRQAKHRTVNKNTSLSTENNNLASNLKYTEKELQKSKKKLDSIEDLHRQEIATLKFKMNVQIKELRNKLKAMSEELKKGHVEIMELGDEVSNLNESIDKELTINTKDGKSYNMAVRKSVYHCARRQVPIGSISSVISSCVKLVTNQQPTQMPCTSTIANMIAEMKVLSMCKAVDAMLKSDYVNIAWDATTIKTDHINEIHVNTDSGSYMLDYKALGRYDNVGYVDHIVSVLRECAEVYSNSKKLDNGDIPEEFSADKIYDDIRGRITSTLSDRAAVNKKVHAKLCEVLGRDLLDLSCNVHPLDSLSIAYRKITKTFEKEENCTSALYGQQSILERLILIINKIKYKESSGDPSAFRAYLDMHSLDKNLIIRYVGNRFHVIFQMCANIFYLREPILDYLRSTCGKAYAKDIIKALESDTILKELVVGGLFGKCLTGPWMKTLYRNSDISNLLESGKYLQKAVTNLERVVEDPGLLWSAEYDCFDRTVESLQTDPIRLALTTVEPDEKMKGLAQLTAETFLVAIRHHDKDYLDAEEGPSMSYQPKALFS